MPHPDSQQTASTVRRVACGWGRRNQVATMSSNGESRGSLTGGTKLDRLDGLRQAERRAAISRVASVIGHLIGTPLNVIAGRAGLIRASKDATTSAEHAKRIEQQVSQLAERVRQLIDALTAPEPAAQFRPANSVVGEALELYQPVALERRVELSSKDGVPPTWEIDAASGLLVLTSLLSLATRTAGRGAHVVLESETSPIGVRFSLTIPGLDLGDIQIDRLEPPSPSNPRTVDALQVIGVCQTIVSRHGGSLDVTRSPDRATVRFDCVARHGEPS